MSRKSKIMGSARLLLAVSGFSVLLLWASGQTGGQESTDKGSHAADAKAGARGQFLSALGAYHNQQYAAAQAQLEPLIRAAPDSFDANELLGLVYVGEGEPEKANRFLAKAVQLRPSVTEARTALATNLFALHRTREAEVQFRKAVELQPRSYDANHNLGEFYIQSGKLSGAIPALRHAQQIDPAAYNNGYDLALALEQTRQYAEAAEVVHQLLHLRDQAELHSLLGDIDEKVHRYMESAAEYEKAARMDPSEQNIFNWGVELLLHQTFAPAVEVFKAGLERFPQSPQLRNGLGIAWYGAGHTDEAVRAFFLASDLRPADPMPLVFLGSTCDTASAELRTQILARLQEFLSRTPSRADLNYDLASCLLKSDQINSNADLDRRIEALLNRAITADPNYADAYFQLGNLYEGQRRYQDAVEQYERASRLNDNSAAIHYRLGQALARSGNSARANEEFAIFQRLQKSETAATNKQMNTIQEFVYTMRDSDAKQP
jgi:tetratricopeptide (TPR) repeat protein